MPGEFEQYLADNFVFSAMAAPTQEVSSGSGHTQKTEAPPNAQKRFRARQKEKMSSLEREVSKALSVSSSSPASSLPGPREASGAAQVAEKQAAYAQLTAENEVLKRKEKVLEKVPYEWELAAAARSA